MVRSLADRTFQLRLRRRHGVGSLRLRRRRGVGRLRLLPRPALVKERAHLLAFKYDFVEIKISNMSEYVFFCSSFFFFLLFLFFLLSLFLFSVCIYNVVYIPFYVRSLRKYEDRKCKLLFGSTSL